VTGKRWIENEILQPLGLYWITGFDGILRLKSMKHSSSIDTKMRTITISHNQTIGIPETTRWSSINMFQATLPEGDDQDKTVSLNLVQQESLNFCKEKFVGSLNTNGISLAHAGYARMFLLANRMFARHAFGTPVYKIKTFLRFVPLELADFINLTHPLVLDLKTGTMGISNVLCEIINRDPDYANGFIIFDVIDTRFISVPNGSYEIAAAADSIPIWSSASAEQKARYMFVSDNTGKYSDATAGNEIG
jgi:hypothetical protein